MALLHTEIIHYSLMWCCVVEWVSPNVTQETYWPSKNEANAVRSHSANDVVTPEDLHRTENYVRRVNYVH